MCRATDGKFYFQSKIAEVSDDIQPGYRSRGLTPRFYVPVAAAAVVGGEGEVVRIRGEPSGAQPRV